MTYHVKSLTFTLILIITSFELSVAAKTDDILERPKIISVELGAVNVDSGDPKLHPVALQNRGDVHVQLVNDHKPEADQGMNTAVRHASIRAKSNRGDVQTGKSSASVQHGSSINTGGMEEKTPSGHRENRHHENPAMDDVMGINRFMNASLAHFLNLSNIFGRRETASLGRVKTNLPEHPFTGDMLRDHRFVNMSLAHFLSDRIHRLTRLGESTEHVVGQKLGQAVPIRAHAKPPKLSQKSGERSGYLARKHKDGGSPLGKLLAFDHEQYNSDSGVSGRDPNASGLNGRGHFASGLKIRDPDIGSLDTRDPVIGGLNGQDPDASGLKGRDPIVGGLNGRDPIVGGLNGRDPDVGVLNARGHYDESLNGRIHYSQGLNGREQTSTSSDGRHSPNVQASGRGYFYSGRNHHVARPRPNMGKHAHKHKLALDVEAFRKAILFGFALGVLCVLILFLAVVIAKRLLPKRFSSAIRRLPYGKEKPLSWSSSDYSPITLLLSPVPRSTSATRGPTLTPCDKKT